MADTAPGVCWWVNDTALFVEDDRNNDEALYSLVSKAGDARSRIWRDHGSTMEVEENGQTLSVPTWVEEDVFDNTDVVLCGAHSIKMDQLNSEAGQMEPNGLVEAKKTFGMYTNFVSIDYLDLVTADYDYFQFYVREMENNTAVNLQMHFYLAHPSMNREDRSKIVETGQVPILPEYIDNFKIESSWTRVQVPLDLFLICDNFGSSDCSGSGKVEGDACSGGDGTGICRKPRDVGSFRPTRLYFSHIPTIPTVQDDDDNTPKNLRFDQMQFVKDISETTGVEGVQVHEYEPEVCSNFLKSSLDWTNMPDEVLPGEEHEIAWTSTGFFHEVDIALQAPFETTPSIFIRHQNDHGNRHISWTVPEDLVPASGYKLVISSNCARSAKAVHEFEVLDLCTLSLIHCNANDDYCFSGVCGPDLCDDVDCGPNGHCDMGSCACDVGYIGQQCGETADGDLDAQDVLNQALSGIPTSSEYHPSHTAADVCRVSMDYNIVKRFTDPTSECSPNLGQHSVRCCSRKGGNDFSCHSTSTQNGACYPEAATYLEAAAACIADDRKLCTTDELARCCIDDELCHYNSVEIWTSEECLL